MYVNKVTLEAVSGFTAFGNNVYWSSTEYDSYSSRTQYFSWGNQYLGSKYHATLVRAVRAF